jgi:membrane-bound lytic murein transglycosylase A
MGTNPNQTAFPAGNRRRAPNAVLALAAAALVLVLIGCQTTPKAPPAPEAGFLSRLSPGSFPEFGDDLDFEGLEQAIEGSIRYLSLIPAERELAFGPDRFTAGHVLRSLRHFQNFIRIRPSSKSLQKFIASDFLVYQSVGRDQQGEVLFTGYYEPELEGRSATGPEFRYPVYGRPDDLVTLDLGAFGEKYKGDKLVGRLAGRSVVPYHERREIDLEGAVFGKAQPLAWVRDPVELFFLHVQGSGKIILEDGRVLNAHYDVANGRPYRSIGQLLIEEGKIGKEEMSLQRIRAYLDQNPAEIPRILSHNPSYIFFRAAEEGPLGSLNVKLTPGRSLALDKKLYPQAALAFVETKKPLSDGFGKVRSWVDCRRFVLNQDTGGAIVGPGRADLFWGGGPYAEIAAGHLKHPGRMFFLVRKPGAGSP